MASVMYALAGLLIIGGVVTLACIEWRYRRTWRNRHSRR